MISSPLYRGHRQYRLVVESGNVQNHFGKPICFNGHEEASAFLRKLSRDENNEPRLRRFMHQLAEQRVDVWRTPLSRLCAVLARRRDLKVVEAHHPWLATNNIRTNGQLTVSRASWHATASLYPSSAHPHRPDKWRASALTQLLKARAAIDLYAPSSLAVEGSGQFSSAIERMLKPYHCTENFPPVDVEVDASIKHFRLSLIAHEPHHPDIPDARLAKTYGPFFHFEQRLQRDAGMQTAAGGQTITTPINGGSVYIHFYRIGTADSPNAPHH